MPPLKSLQFFMTAAQAGSFKTAAKQLNVTQAAVSQQIKQLEEYLDVRLFERNNRQTKLTGLGERLLPFIEQGFDQFKLGLQQISGDVSPHVLRISAIHSFTSLWLLPRLQEFQSMHPDIMVQIAPSNDLVDFGQAQVDLAIRMGRGNYPGLLAKPMVTDQLILVASSTLVDNEKKQDPAHVFALPWIEDTSTDVVPIFKQLCLQHQVNSEDITSVICTNNSVILIENALAGRGVTLINKSLVADHLRSGALVKLLDFSQPSPYSLYLAAPEHHFQWPKVKAFEAWMVPLVDQSFADLSAW